MLDFPIELNRFSSHKIDGATKITIALETKVIIAMDTHNGVIHRISKHQDIIKRLLSASSLLKTYSDIHKFLGEWIRVNRVSDSLLLAGRFSILTPELLALGYHLELDIKGTGYYWELFLNDARLFNEILDLTKGI